MFMQDQILFEEKQYIGYNKWAMLWRMVLALFCFLLYYWSENPKPVDVSGITIPESPVGENSGQLFFLMGLFIMLLSAIMIFLLHFHTKIINNTLMLDGLWTSRKAKIDLNNIVEVKKVTNNTNILNPPIYNLHFNNKIHFFTHGHDSIELTDKDGIKYSIGSQKAEELFTVLQKLTSIEKR